MSLDQLQTALDSKPLHEGLPEIFRDELRWPTGPTTTQTVKIANQNLAAKPIAQAAGVPVFLVHLPAGTDLPGVTGRREAHRSLGATFAEHMLIFVDHPGAACQFVWARAKGEKQPLKLAVLPYEQHGPARTTLERLDKLRLPIEEHGLVDILRRLEDAFSVEPLSKAFFTEISDLFFEVADGLAKQIGDENERRLFVQTLFNRLIFLRFVEKKGWLKGMGHGPNYLQALWQAGQDGVNPFWPTRLSALFTSLNRPKGDRVREVSKPLIGEVPYLNGGLFEDSPRFADPKLTIPPDVFRKLVGPNGLFYRYNFTVEESSPLDVQVAVDPEILGKIFEQLTLSAKRHDTGSYYTPREIVQFMCREALVGYLSSSSEGSPGVPPVGPPDPASARSPAGTPGLLSGSPAGTPGLHPGPGVRLPEAKARALVYEHDDSTLTNHEGNLAFAALKAIKVVDPACGSGAYLLGMLQELYALFEILRRDDRKFSPDPAKEAHERKLWIIENNIYGVDLQAFATNTAMLRLWLTLLVEDSGKEPQPLPNLEYKIETGDSLLGPDPSQPIDWSKSQRGLDFESVHDTVAALRRLRERYQNAHGEGKIVVKKELEAKLAELREKVTGSSTKDPAKFDWRVEFFDVFLDDGNGRSPGFDAVAMNPPYITANRLPGDRRESFGLFMERLRTAFGFKSDLYVHFLHRALDLLCSGGVMSAITPSTFFTNTTKIRIRQLLLENRLKWLIPLGPDVFDAAVNSAISVALKSDGADGEKVGYANLRKDNEEALADVEALASVARFATIANYRRAFANIFYEPSPENEVLFDTLLSATEEVSVDGAAFIPLNAIAPALDTGIDSGNVRPYLFFLDQSHAGLRRRLLQGTQVIRYGAWWDRPRARYRYVDVDYEADPDEPGVGRGGEPSGRGEYWHFRGPIENHHVVERLLMRQTEDEPFVGYIHQGDEKIYTDNTIHTLLLTPLGRSHGLTLKYVMAILNSAPLRKIYQAIAQEGGRALAQVKTTLVNRLPIRLASSADQSALESLVARIMDLHANGFPLSTEVQAEIAGIQAEIDARVEFLYFHQDEAPTYDAWIAQREAEKGTAAEEVRKLLALGHETERFECKSSFAWDVRKGEAGDWLKDEVHTAICALLNANGGDLLIGVDDDMNVLGLSPDLARYGNLDKLIQAIENPLGKTLTPNPIGLVRIEAVDLNGTTILRIHVQPDRGERYRFKDQIYVRRNSKSKPALTPDEAASWWPRRQRLEV